MQKTVLEQVVMGKLNPYEQKMICESKYKIASKSLLDKEQELLATLNDKQKALYEECEYAQMELCILNSTDKFIKGYRLGALMMMEVMSVQNEVSP